MHRHPLPVIPLAPMIFAFPYHERSIEQNPDATVPVEHVAVTPHIQLVPDQALVVQVAVCIFAIGAPPFNEDPPEPCAFAHTPDWQGAAILFASIGGSGDSKTSTYPRMVSNNGTDASSGA